MGSITVEHLADIASAVGDVDARWVEALGGLHSSSVVDDDVDAMSDAGLLAVNDALAALERRCQALHVRIANGIGKRSARELGVDGLARKAGFRSAAKLIAAATGGHPADAERLIQVGDAVAGRLTFTGERAPARHPHLGEALQEGRISVAVAGAITSLLDRLAFRVGGEQLEEAERTLSEQAAGLSLADVRVILRRAEAYLDPDGLEPKIDDLRAQAYLKLWEDPTGMICVDGKLDPERGAPVKAVIDSLVTAQIRATRGHNRPGEDAARADVDGSAGGDAAASGWAWDAPADDGSGGLGAHVEHRTIAQLQADALVAVCKHLLSCDDTAAPLVNTTVIVRIPLDALTSGTGVATIDGISQPVDAGTARRMAADAQIIPAVLGGESEILDFGRTRRLFTRAQRLAMIERDGGCIGCAAPPGHTEAHHLTWWSCGGTTDVDDGVLLCTSCHHTVHAEGWEIRIDGNHVWLIPPAHIDPTRTPRPGGRHRFDYGRAA